MWLELSSGESRSQVMGALSPRKDSGLHPKCDGQPGELVTGPTCVFKRSWCSHVGNRYSGARMEVRRPLGGCYSRSSKGNGTLGWSGSI